MLRLFENKPNPCMLVPHALGLNLLEMLMDILEVRDPAAHS
jgi:hypothetical protein